MKKLIFVPVLGIFAALVAAQPALQDAKLPVLQAETKVITAEKAAQESMLTLLTALEARDYANFTRVITDEFKTALPKKKFDEVAAHFGPRLERGCTAVFLGEIKKGGTKTSIWKLVYKDEGDDTVAMLSFKQGDTSKVTGFWLN